MQVKNTNRTQTDSLTDGRYCSWNYNVKGIALAYGLLRSQGFTQQKSPCPAFIAILLYIHLIPWPESFRKCQASSVKSSPTEEKITFPMALTESCGCLSLLSVGPCVLLDKSPKYIYVLHMWLFPSNTNCIILNICSELGFSSYLTTHFRVFFCFFVFWFF